MLYLQAVIKEGLRNHPILGLLLGRVLPPGEMSPDGASYYKALSWAAIRISYLATPKCMDLMQISSALSAGCYHRAA